MGGNGSTGGAGDQPRRGRVRIDRPGGAAAGTGGGAGAVPSPMGALADDGAGGFWSSGRVFVTAAVVAVLLLWGALDLAFRQWRARYRERASYGARVVAGAVEPLASVVPPGAAVRVAGVAGAAPGEVDPAAWRDAVARTRAMLLTLTSSNALDTAAMRTLGREVTARVARARAHPESARDELASLWDDIESRAGPLVTARHPRPALLRPRATSPAR